jgi:tyrosyl-tRNA synthetase
MKSLTEQLTLIRRGVVQIETFEELHKKLERSLKTNKPLRVKYGIDPTGIDVHLGHTVPLRKMRLFQELGHQAVLIIGNYTALVGDPSGRDQTRAKLTQESVEANAKEYLEQVSKIIDISKTEVHRNGDWFSKYDFLRVMELCGKITVQRMLERDDFTKRYKDGTPISLHECLYPLMQGQDSVEIHADIELGGSEQLFNLMVGRKLQQDAGQEPQICLTLPILRGLDGHRRMGKSLGNYVGVGEPAREQFGKTMSIPDDLLKEWFELLTDRAPEDITRLLDPKQTHPMEAKKTVAADIVTFYHGSEAAQHARTDWEKQFSAKQDPDEIPEAKIGASKLVEGKLSVCPLLVEAGLAPSNKEARRKIGEGAVTIGPDRRKITDPTESIIVENGLVLRLGRKIVRVNIEG